MYIILLALLFITTKGAELTTPPPNCYLYTGCANAATCQCTLYVTQCSIANEPQGKCVLTPFGVVVVVIMCILVGILIVLLVCCLWCCCPKKCCKSAKLPNNITYNYLTPPNFMGGTTPFNVHSDL
jgi:hypothetical protein